MQNSEDSPVTLDRLLSRHEAAEYARRRGIPLAVATLAKLASIGGGPLITYYGRKPLYRPSDLDAWLDARLTRAASTADRRRARLTKSGRQTGDDHV